MVAEGVIHLRSQQLSLAIVIPAANYLLLRSLSLSRHAMGMYMYIYIYVQRQYLMGFPRNNIDSIPACESQFSV